MALDANSSCRNDLETRELREFSRFSLVNRDAGALLPFASRGLRFDSSPLRGRGCFYSYDAIEHPERLRRKIKNKGDGRGRDQLRKLRRTCQQLPSRVSSMFHPRDSRRASEHPSATRNRRVPAKSPARRKKPPRWIRASSPGRAGDEISKLVRARIRLAARDNLRPRIMRANDILSRCRDAPPDETCSSRACSRDELSNSLLAAGCLLSGVLREGDRPRFPGGGGEGGKTGSRRGGKPVALIDTSRRAIISRGRGRGWRRREGSLTCEAPGAVANA